MKAAVERPNRLMARTLYLADREHKQITASGGQALVVCNSCGQSWRYPLQRVARIVSSMRVDWSGSALLLCQQSIIPITWLDGSGQPQGTLFPRLVRELSFHQTLELVLQSRESIESFHNWQQQRRLKVMHASTVRMGQRADLARVELLVRAWIYRSELKPRLPAFLYGLCSAWVAAEMSAFGLRPQYPGPRGQILDLLEILSNLIWAQWNLCNKAEFEQAQTHAEQVGVVEKWQEVNGAVLLEHLYSLQRWATANYLN